LGTEIGGDFFDVFEAVDGHFVVIGDVCGKGPVAAALTALCRHTLRACALRNTRARPAELLALLNSAILLPQQRGERLRRRVCVGHVRAPRRIRG